MNYKNFPLKLRCTFYSQKPTERKNCNFNEAKNIGVLIYNPNPKFNPSVNFFIRELKDAGKNVQVLVFQYTKNPIRLDYTSNDFSLNDFDWKGSVKSEIIENFIKTPFDYLYSINISPFLPFKFILQRSKAKCKIGKYEKDGDLDFMIQLSEKQNLDILVDQMMVYSKKIRTND